MSILLTETFNDQTLHGEFYDTFTAPTAYSTTEQYSGNSCAKFTWDINDTEPNGVNTASRWTFTTTETIYTSFYWKLNSDWLGTGYGVHPHIIYITSDVDGDWANLEGGHLRVYIEVTDTVGNIRPRMIIGREGAASWHETIYNLTRSIWYHFETYHVMNTIGSSNGIMRMWVTPSGGATTLVYDSSSVLYRDADHTGMKFYEISIGPWISPSSGVGSPYAQTMWMDELIIGTEYLSTGRVGSLSMPNSRLCNKTNVRRLHPKL